MASDVDALLKYRVECSLEILCDVLRESQLSNLWWLLDDTKRSRAKRGNALTLFEQIGVESQTFVDVFGAKWRSKDGVLPFSFVKSIYDGCNFVTVRLNEESETGHTLSVTESGIVNKNDDKLQYLKALISERVQLGVDAYLSAVTDESSTADDMDISDDDADTSFDTTTSGDTDTSMEEVDGSSDDGASAVAAVAVAEKRKPTADQASADGTANKVSRDATSQDTGSAKASSTTLSPELLALKDVLFDDQGNLKQDVATVIQSCIKDKKKLAPQELKLAGCLFKKAVNEHADKSHNEVRVVSLSSFRGERSYKAAIVPTTYQHSKATKAATIARNERRDRVRAQEWMELLSSWSLRKYVVQMFLNDNPEFTKEMVRKFYRELVRFDTETTAAIMVYVQMNSYQLKKLSRIMRYYSGGIRFFAPLDSVAALKAKWWDENFESLRYTLKTMTRTVKSKNGSFERDTPVLVCEVRPFEHMILSAEGLVNTDRWVPGSVRFKVPWSVHGRFSDYSLFKFQIDAGAGSTKMIINSVNVNNPQGQEHVGIVCEFSGVKDTYKNVKAAAFQDDSQIKSDMESVAQRKVVILLLRLRISQDETRTQVIIASNTESNHDIYSPQPLPQLGSVTDIQADLISDENRMGIVALDFSLVDSVRVLHSEDRNTVLGLSFFDADNCCIATSFIRKPMTIEHLSIDTVSLELQQILAGAVLSPDIAFLSTFQGHQGASSTNPCNFCHIKLCDMKRCFDTNCPDTQLRSVESTLQDYETFQTKFENLPAKDQTKALHASVTQNHSHSINKELMAKFPLDCIMKALLHVRLGVSRSLLDWIFDFYLKIEELYTGECYKSSKSIRDELDRLIAFEVWTTEELSHFATSISGHEKQMEELMSRLEDIQGVLDIPRISQPVRNKWQDSLAKVEQDIEKLKEDKYSDDELEFVVQLTEMKRIANENIKHLRILLSKHDGYSRRIIVDALKRNTVDIQVYFNGVLNGPHCIKLAENGDAIISAITAEMLNLVADNDTLCDALRNFEVQMKRVLKPWYSLMRFLPR